MEPILIMASVIFLTVLVGMLAYIIAYVRTTKNDLEDQIVQLKTRIRILEDNDILVELETPEEVSTDTGTEIVRRRNISVNRAVQSLANCHLWKRAIFGDMVCVKTKNPKSRRA